MLLSLRRRSRIALSFDGLTFLNVKGEIPMCSPHLTFKCLSVSPSKDKRSLNLKKFASFLRLLKGIWSLQQFKMLLKGFLNLVLLCNEMSPRYGSDRIKDFCSTVVTWGRFMTNLLITILKHLSINDKGYPLFKNTCFKTLSSSSNFVQSEQI